MKRKKILLVSHVTKTPGMVYKFYGYLHSIYSVGLLLHPLYPTSEVRSSFSFEAQRTQMKLPFFLQYFLEFFFNFYVFLKNKKKRFDIIICFDPLSFFNIFFYKLLHHKVKIIYYNLDYSPIRFANKTLNNVYQKINYFAFIKCDYFFCPTEKFTKDLDPKNKFSHKSFVFPHTVDVNSIKRNMKRLPNSIIYAGTLSNTVDFAPLIKALKNLQKRSVKFTFDIYGDGIYKKKIEEMIKENNLENVKMRGVVDNTKLINEIFPKFELAVAPYISSKKKTIANHMFLGTDLTSKIVEYIAAGLVVVSTRIYDAFDIIENQEFGELVRSEEQWESVLQNLLHNKKKQKKYRKNAIAYSKKYDARVVVLTLIESFLEE